MVSPAVEAVDDEDDSFERVDDLNDLELPDDEDGESSGGDSELDDELKILLLKSEVSEAKCDLELLQFDYAVVKAALGVVSFALLLACLYIFTYSGHVESCQPPPPAIECPKISACPPAPPVPECPKCASATPVPKCPAAPSAPECPKAPACKEKTWDYENPSLKLGTYPRYASSTTFSRSASFEVLHYSITLTGGFVTGFGGSYDYHPDIGEEIIAVDGVDVREKSAQEIDEMIHQPKSMMGKLFGMSTHRWQDRSWGHSVKLSVRKNTVYFNRIRDAVAEASDVSFKRGVLATVLIVLLGRMLIREFIQMFTSKDKRSDYAVVSNGQLPTMINAVEASNVSVAEKTFVQQLSAGDDTERENEAVAAHDEEVTTITVEGGDEKSATSDLTDVINQQAEDNRAEEKESEATGLTAVINAQKVQVEDNRVELEMFADRLAELKRDCERMEKARTELTSQTADNEPEAKRSWLDRMLDECGIPQNGG